MSVLEYKCPCCGAGLVFSSDSQQMRCDSCGNTFELSTVEEFNATLQDNSDQFDWENYDVSSGSGDWTQEERETMQTFVCPSCGGVILTEATTAATFCPYCENPAVLPGRLSNTFRPDAVIPFRFKKEDAQAAFQKFCKGKKLLPKSFVVEQRMDRISGMYVPFWVFDCGVEANMRYRATRIHTWSDANYRYTRTDYFLLQRHGALRCNGVPVDGSKKMDNAYMEAIEPYDYSQAVPFQPAYLSGFLADQYDVTSEECQPVVNQRIRTTTESLFSRTAVGYATVVPENRSVHIQAGKIQYMLLPVWVLNSSYAGKTYTFAMNGQTGKFVGRLPISLGRCWAWFGGVCGAVTAAAALLGVLANLF